MTIDPDIGAGPPGARGSQRRVAIVQMPGAALDPDANARTTVAAIEHAADDGANLVVLPELIGPGYVLRPEIAAIAEDQDDPGVCLTAWKAVAKRRQIAVIAGFAELDGDALFNSSVVIDSCGEIVDVYRKLHLFGAEREIFTPGDHGLVLTDVDGIKVGVLVCYDLRFVEALRSLALQGAEVIAVPTAWVAGFDWQPPGAPARAQIPHVDGAIVQANLSQVYVAAAGMVGSVDGRTFLGSSVVVDPYGNPMVGPFARGETRTAVATIDMATVSAARHRGEGINPFTDRRTDVYGDLAHVDLTLSPTGG